MVTAQMNWLTASGGATISHANFEQYPQVQVPVLAVHGTADGSTDPTGNSDLINAVSSPDKTFDAIEGGQHALLDETSDEETLGVVLDWLRARVPARATPQR